MMSQQKKISFIMAGLLVLLLVIATVGYGLYGVYINVSDSQSVRLISRILNLPAAKVGSESVPYSKFIMTRDAVVKFINSDAGKEVNAVMPSDKELNTNILDRLIRQAMVNQMAKEKNITISDDEVSSVFEDVKRAAASSTTPDVGEYLWNNYGWNEENFRAEVLKPALLEQKLAMEMAQNGDGNEYALETALEARREEPDVVIYLKFK